MPKITSIKQFAEYFSVKWQGNKDMASELQEELEERIEDIIGGGLTTLDAFEKLISQRNIHEELGVSSHIIRNYRYSLKNNKPVNQDKIEELLRKAGYEIVQERKWRKG